MRSASIAEWMVSRITGRKRAASLVGDLVELKPQKGSLWFWLSLAGVVLSLTWRRLVAFVAAFYAGSWAMSALSMAISGMPFDSPHRPPLYPWGPVFSVLSEAGAILWMTLLYAAICYGFRDKLAQFTFLWTVVVTGVCYWWWQSAVLAVCIVLALSAIAALIVHAQWRRAALSLFVSVVVGYGGFLGLAGYVSFRYQRYVVPGPMGDRELRAHPSICWMAFLMFLLATWITTAACSTMHRWFLEKSEPESGVDFHIDG